MEEKIFQLSCNLPDARSSIQQKEAGAGAPTAIIHGAGFPGQSGAPLTKRELHARDNPESMSALQARLEELSNETRIPGGCVQEQPMGRRGRLSDKSCGMRRNSFRELLAKHRVRCPACGLLLNMRYFSEHAPSARRRSSRCDGPRRSARAGQEVRAKDVQKGRGGGMGGMEGLATRIDIYEPCSVHVPIMGFQNLHSQN